MSDTSEKQKSVASASAWSNWFNSNGWRVAVGGAVMLGIGVLGYKLTRPTKVKKKTNKRRNAPKSIKYEKTFNKAPVDINLVMKEINAGYHAHVGADKKNSKLGLKYGSSVVKINNKRVENLDFEKILVTLQNAKFPINITFREYPELETRWNEANKFKEEANQFYKNNQIEQAVELISRAIELHPTNKTYYSNRVLMLMKLERLEEALNDCQKIRELDPLSAFVKGHYLRGLVLFNLGMYKHAKSAFQTVLKLKSDFKKAQERLKECTEKLGEIAAQNDIESKEEIEQYNVDEDASVEVKIQDNEQQQREVETDVNNVNNNNNNNNNNINVQINGEDDADADADNVQIQSNDSEDAQNGAEHPLDEIAGNDNIKNENEMDADDGSVADDGQGMHENNILDSDAVVEGNDDNNQIQKNAQNIN